MRHIKQKIKQFSIAILAGLVLCAAPSLAEIKATYTTPGPMTLASVTKKKSKKAGSIKLTSKKKSRSSKQHSSSPKPHATWHAPRDQLADNTKKTAAWRPIKSKKKMQRSSHVRHPVPAAKAKQKSVAALREPTPPAPEMTAPPLATPQPQQPSTAVAKSLAAKPLTRRPTPAIIDANADSDRIAVDDSTSPSYSLIMLALLMAAGACYMYFTRRQQTLVNQRQPERQLEHQSMSSKSSSRSSRRRRRQTDDTNKPNRSAETEDVSSMPVSAADIHSADQGDEGDVTPPPPSSSPGADKTAQLPLVPQCTFEVFVEIQMALSTWIDQGADTLANLHNHFGLSEAEWLLASAYWGPKYLADDDLIRKFNALSAEFRTKYRGSAA